MRGYHLQPGMQVLHARRRLIVHSIEQPEDAVAFNLFRPSKKTQFTVTG